MGWFVLGPLLVWHSAAQGGWETVFAVPLQGVLDLGERALGAGGVTALPLCVQMVLFFVTFAFLCSPPHRVCFQGFPLDLNTRVTKSLPRVKKAMLLIARHITSKVLGVQVLVS